jgi:hypothetical protein
MKTNSRTPPGGSFHGEGSDPSNLVATMLILWENFATASAAKDAWCEIEKEGQPRIWRESMWKFDLLRMPRFCEEAAREAAEAEWIIVAFESDFMPSPGLQHWLDGWREKASGKPQSLVALCVSPQAIDQECGLIRELRTFACRVGCEFQVRMGPAAATASGP